MILKEATFESEIIGGKKTADFRINIENSIIFKILRSYIYTNPIAAICREILTNARDANIEAGHKDKPIEIELRRGDPNLTPDGTTLHIRDYGLGISPDRMYNIFIEYGASSKRDTNEQAGAFGLGAKTPFAYTDLFTIITVCDVSEKRYRFTYSALIDSTKKGQITLLSKQTTTQPTGTTIVIPIKSGDIHKFTSCCFDVVALWFTRPILIGFESEFPKQDCVYKSERYSIYKKINAYCQHTTILIDEIPYLLDEKYNSLITDCHNIVLPFKVGELSISANREQLHYDESTIALIKQRFADVKEDIKKQIAERFAAIPDYLGTCIYHAQCSYASKNAQENDYLLDLIVNNSGIEPIVKTTKFSNKLLISAINLKRHVVSLIKINNDIPIKWYVDKLLTDAFRHCFFTEFKRQLRTKNAVIQSQYGINEFVLITPIDYSANFAKEKNLPDREQYWQNILQEQKDEYVYLTELLNPKDYDAIITPKTPRAKREAKEIDPKTIPTRWAALSGMCSATAYRHLNQNRKIIIDDIDKDKQIVLIPVDNIKCALLYDTLTKIHLVSGIFNNVDFLVVNKSFIRYFDNQLTLDKLTSFILKNKRRELHRFIVALNFNHHFNLYNIVKRLSEYDLIDLVKEHEIVPKLIRKTISLHHKLVWPKHEQLNKHDKFYKDIRTLSGVHQNGKVTQLVDKVEDEFNQFMESHILFKLAYQNSYCKYPNLASELKLYFDSILQSRKTN